MLWGEPNKVILDELGDYVAGHTEAKKVLISLVNRSRRRYKQKWQLCVHNDFLLSPLKVLLIGASGTGKTLLVESLHTLVDFPLLRFDATKLNPTGASGGVKEETMRKKIVDNATFLTENYPDRYPSIDATIDETVVFIDELDKLGQSFDSSGRWNDHVQSNFLTLFDNKNEFAGISFIFAGAFTSITDDEPTKSMGFSHQASTGSNEHIENKLIEAGLIPELVGRINSIVELDRFTKEDYYNILVNKILPKKQMDMAAFGVFDVDISIEQAWEITERAVKSNQGVRSLQRELDRMFLDFEFYCETDYANPTKGLE